MTAQDFLTQMKRLQSQWPNSYSDERAQILFKAFKETDALTFTEAITDLIATQRAAPLLPELSKAVDLAKQRARERLSHHPDANFLSIMQTAATKNKTANTEHVQACMKLISGYLKPNGYSKPQFNQGIRILEQACGLAPIPNQSNRDKATGDKNA